MENCKISNLYNLNETIAKDLLVKYTYPWEVLPKIEEFMKFDREQVIPYPGFHIGEQSTFPISIFEVLLNDKILLEKRQYIQLSY